MPQNDNNDDVFVDQLQWMEDKDQLLQDAQPMPNEKEPEEPEQIDDNFVVKALNDVNNLVPEGGANWIEQQIDGAVPPVMVQQEPALYMPDGFVKSKPKTIGVGSLKYQGKYQATLVSQSTPAPSIKGLMVFYINTGNMAAGSALDHIDKVKAQYRATEVALRAKQIEVMWLPRSEGKSQVKFIPLG